jgi:hypothetical protein
MLEACMHRTIKVVVFAFTLIISAVSTANSAEIPMVMYTTGDDIILQDTTDLRTTLGINYIYGTIDSYAVSNLKAAGFGLIKWGGVGSSKNVNYYSGKSYFVVAAVDNSAFVRFYLKNGYESNGKWVSDAAGMALDSLCFGQSVMTGFYEDQFPREYFVQMRLAIDPAGVSEGDTIGIIYVHKLLNDTTSEERASIPIIADDSLLTGRTFEVPANPPSYTLGSQGDWGAYTTKYSFWNSGKTTVYIDSLKSYDIEGQRLIESSVYNNLIDSLVTDPIVWNQIDYWWLRDEPKYDYFAPWKKVKDLVNTAAGADKSIGAFWPTSINGGWTKEDIAATVRSFVLATHQNRIIYNDYPFNGGLDIDSTITWFTAYTGNTDQDCTAHSYRGIQKEIELISVKIMGVLAEEIRDGGILEEFWQSPQWMYSGADTDEGEPPDTKYIFRPLTRSELRLQIGLGLCYGSKGFNFWRYDYSLCDPGRCNIGSDNSCWQGGFYDTIAGVPQRNTLMWSTMSEDINPYLKAIGNTYMELEWQNAYPIYKDSVTSPGNAIVSSISAISNSPDSNPDLGWFHVGEFTKSGTTDKYIILLNRACSQGIFNAAEAPPVTATVKFNRDNLGLGAYLLITDLADTVVDSSGQWVGDPRTTYSATMPDGTIPYTVTLRAGEGKLIKIAQAPKALNFVGDLFADTVFKDSYIYQGGIKLLGDLTIA